MTIIQSLDQAYVDTKLQCPAGKSRIEIVDPMRTGMYIEVRATSPGQGTYYLRYKNAAGKTCHQKIGRTTDITLAEARKRTKNLKAEIQVGKAVPSERHEKQLAPTLDEYWTSSFQPYILPRKRSAGKDESLYRLYLKEKFGDVRLTDLRRQELQTYHADLLKKGLSEASADHVLKLVRSMLNRAVEWEIIVVNPIARFKMFNPDNRRTDALSAESLSRLVHVLKTDRNRPVCNVALFLLSTGARLNEALSAKWEHVDKQNRVWLVPALTAKGKRVRSIPLGDAAVEVLNAVGTEGKSEFVFVGRTGAHLKHIHKVFARIAADAGLPQLAPHGLRHAFAGMLINSGRSLYEVQKILGHSSASVTEKYSILNSKSLMDAANSASVIIQRAMPTVA